jgi:glycerol transport system substrate-binding protein
MTAMPTHVSPSNRPRATLLAAPMMAALMLAPACQRPRTPAAPVAAGPEAASGEPAAHPPAPPPALDPLQVWTTVLQPTTLSPEQQLAELRWFQEAGKPFAGMEIRVASENLAPHQYESKLLAKAFTELTGIKVVHDVIGEGEVIEKLLVQLQSGAPTYDMFVNDTDFLGTHYRYGGLIALSDFMSGDGQAVTLPTLDVDDFIGKRFGTGPDGKLYQLPAQQFGNFYWFRYDWFSRDDLKQRFQAKYGYELGVPINWSAYEDIANFFTNDVKELDGQRVYGHMDYGARDPSLGWRFTDAWLSIAGTGSEGLPNGSPIDEWGIRAEACRPAGASVSRGGETNGPASVYALTKYIEWLKKYAPPEAASLSFAGAGVAVARGNIAQQIFWYTPFTQSLTNPGQPISNPDGTLKWRIAPTPHGAYWREGMKRGYQDVGAWTMPANVPLERRKAAWLYAQFTVSKSVSLQKFLVGMMPIRKSDLDSHELTSAAPGYGGLVELYRSRARELWTPTGLNVADYPRMAGSWWPAIADAVEGKKTPQAALDQLAKDLDDSMAALERSGLPKCTPKLGPVKPAAQWLGKPGGPKAKLANEKPKGETMRYEKLLEAWK